MCSITFNGSFKHKPHVVLTIAEREWFAKNGRVGYDEIINKAIDEGRLLDYDKTKKDDLSVIAQTTSLGNITESSLYKSLAQFKKEINSFKEKNKIKYSDRITQSDTDYLSAVERGDMETAHNRYAHVFLEDVQALRDMADIVSRCMIMQVKKARQAQASEYETFGNSHGHEISADQIIEIIKKMAKPNHVGYQGETGRFFEIVHYGKKDKRFDVSVFFDLNAYKDSRYLQKYKSENMHYDIAVTLIPMNKQEIKRLISNINSTVFTPNYKKGVPQLTIGQPVPSVLNDTPFYENSITDSDEKNNRTTQNNSDSGNTNELTDPKSKDDTIIDELVKVARFEKNREDIGNKHENDIGEDGFNYYIAFFMDFDGEYYMISFSSAQNANKETVYSIGKIKKRRFPNRDGSSSKNGALKNGRKSSSPIIYTTEDKSQEVKTAIQLAFEKAFKKQAEESNVENSLTNPKSKDDTIIQHILIKKELKVYSRGLGYNHPDNLIT